MTRIEELEQKVKELQSEIESLKKEESKKFPENGDIYFYISPIGSIDADSWVSHPTDNRRLVIGNCFKTEEEAEFYVERLKVIAELKKFAEPDDTPWDGRVHHPIVYDYLKNEIVAPFYYKTKFCNLYFESFDKAKEAVGAVGANRIKKYYFGVEEENNNDSIGL